MQHIYKVIKRVNYTLASAPRGHIYVTITLSKVAVSVALSNIAPLTLV